MKVMKVSELRLICKPLLLIDRLNKEGKINKNVLLRLKMDDDMRREINLILLH